MSHLSFTILGLGDSNYSKFQGHPRFLDKKLTQFGGHTFYKRGEADDATSLEKVVEPWLKGLPQALLAEVIRLRSLSADKVKDLLTVDEIASLGSEALILASTTTSIYTSKVASKEIISDQDGKKVVEIKLDLGRKVDRERLDVGQSIAISP